MNQNKSLDRIVLLSSTYAVMLKRAMLGSAESAPNRRGQMREKSRIEFPVTPEGASNRVKVRSFARLGRSDFGTNAKRLRTFPTSLRKPGDAFNRVRPILHCTTCIALP
jgi:hypothetical protein